MGAYALIHLLLQQISDVPDKILGEQFEIPLRISKRVASNAQSNIIIQSAVFVMFVNSLSAFALLQYLFLLHWRQLLAQIFCYLFQSVRMRGGGMSLLYVIYPFDKRRLQILGFQYRDMEIFSTTL